MATEAASEDRCCAQCKGPRRCAVSGCEIEHPNACAADLSSAGWRCFMHEQSDDGLRVWTNDTDFVIAHNRADCLAVLAEHLGCSLAQALEENEEADWETWPTSKLLPFTAELDVPSTQAVLKLRPGEGIVRVTSPGHIPSCDLPVAYHVEHDGRIFHLTTRKLPSEWIAVMGRGYFACTEY